MTIRVRHAINPQHACHSADVLTGPERATQRAARTVEVKVRAMTWGDVSRIKKLLDQSGGMMAKRVSDLEARLIEWGKEYGGSRYEYDSGGGSPMGSMIKWGGRPPTGLGHDAITTAGDDVQAAYMALAKQSHGWVPSEVLRCEYWLTGQTRDEKLHKLHKLAKIGAKMDAVRYCQHLRMAKIYVAGSLHIAFSDPLDEDESIAMLEYDIEC